MNPQDRSAERRIMFASSQNDARTDEGFEKLGEASEFFAGSIKLGDLFRLVASRLRGMVPAKGIALYLQDETRCGLRIAEMDGGEAAFADDTFNADACFAKGVVHVAEDGVVAIPLLNELSPFAVIEIRFDPADLSQIVDRSVFETIGIRIAPLILNSIAFERSLSNALSDSLTNLPNERALFLILEQQIAESTRKRDERPLTLLALDIKDFDEINRRLGHAAGDRVLDHVAKTLKHNIRQMDFLARCRHDEFLAVLPTSSKDTANDVIARIKNAFRARRVEISDEDLIQIGLNIGSATFGDDGETADQLIVAARLRKDQAKGAATNKVLWFPKELTS